MSYISMMGKDPKTSGQLEDLKRWDDEGGAPRSGHPSHEPSSVPAPKTEAALYYFNVRTGSELLEDPEGDTYPDLHAARDGAVAKARDLLQEGGQKGEDRRSWHVEIMDRANQHVLTVGFSEALDPKASGKAGAE
jgi:hypothetical protein